MLLLGENLRIKSMLRRKVFLSNITNKDFPHSVRIFKRRVNKHFLAKALPQVSLTCEREEIIFHYYPTVDVYTLL